MLAPVTTVACAVSAPRRSRPDVARVTIAVVAAFPAGTVSPITVDTAPITRAVGCSPITTHPRPATSQAALLSTAGCADRAARSPPARADDRTHGVRRQADGRQKGTATRVLAQQRETEREREPGGAADAPHGPPAPDLRVLAEQPVQSGDVLLLDVVSAHHQRRDEPGPDDGQHALERDGRGGTDRRDHAGAWPAARASSPRAPRSPAAPAPGPHRARSRARPRGSPTMRSPGVPRRRSAHPRRSRRRSSPPGSAVRAPQSTARSRWPTPSRKSKAHSARAEASRRCSVRLHHGAVMVGRPAAPATSPTVQAEPVSASARRGSAITAAR